MKNPGARCRGFPLSALKPLFAARLRLVALTGLWLVLTGTAWSLAGLVRIGLIWVTHRGALL